MSKHTPGPWEFAAMSDDTSGAPLDWCARFEVFTATDEPVKGAFVGFCFDESDARLFAAAPDLLKACKAAMRACQDNLHMYQYKNEPLLLEAYKACEAAIAKAQPSDAATGGTT